MRQIELYEKYDRTHVRPKGFMEKSEDAMEYGERQEGCRPFFFNSKKLLTLFHSNLCNRK